jgi:hypothetical protein
MAVLKWRHCALRLNARSIANNKNDGIDILECWLPGCGVAIHEP